MHAGFQNILTRSLQRDISKFVDASVEADVDEAVDAFAEAAIDAFVEAAVDAIQLRQQEILEIFNCRKTFFQVTMSRLAF